MTSPHATGKWLWLFLFASVACNVGVISAVGMRALLAEKQATTVWEETISRPVVEQGPPNGPDHTPDQHQGRRPRFGDLEFTPEQRRLLRPSRDQLMEKMSELRSKLHEKHDALLELIAAEEPDRDAIDAQLKLLADDRAEMQAAVIDHFLDMKQHLRPDQMDAYRRMLRWAIVSQDHQGPGAGPGNARGAMRRGREMNGPDFNGRNLNGRGRDVDENRPFPRGPGLERPNPNGNHPRKPQRGKNRNFKETEQ